MNNKVAQLRKEKGYTQEEFAKMIGISRPALSAIENGTIPKAKNMLKIANLLNRSIEEIFFNNSSV